ncbi:hypothetical protein SCP_0310770 [Sparassis crispa]|uniref:Uncharacterized protein n=1 Tax=Sparassis crispa TaxID=139825 RepID=A0A401GGN8_9APHY|nr:hypothetical protein SCP_0310770 [Sparassis crispa]GBE81350.1 hypothetical protein SCP_0310770 [Sparassis crispa]
MVDKIAHALRNMNDLACAREFEALKPSLGSRAVRPVVLMRSPLSSTGMDRHLAQFPGKGAVDPEQAKQL